MKPPQPWPMRWHAHAARLPTFVGDAEKWAYIELRMLRGTWRGRALLAHRGARRNRLLWLCLRNTVAFAVSFVLGAVCVGLVRGCAGLP